MAKIRIYEVNWSNTKRFWKKYPARNPPKTESSIFDVLPAENFLKRSQIELAKIPKYEMRPRMPP